MEEKELVLRFAREALVRQKEDGRLARLYTENAATDPASNGEGVLYAGKVLGDPAYKAAADKMLNYLLNLANKNKDGILYHNNDAPEVWSDAGFMAPPLLAIAGHPREAIKQIEGFRQILRDPQKHLYSHIWSDACGYVQGVCGSPRFESSGTATEGQACFLLMEAAFANKKGVP